MSDLDTLAAATALSDHGEPHDPTSVPPSGRDACANCGARLKGRYCADCGQLDQPLRIPVHRFLGQSFAEFFGLDGRVWRTLGVLLFKPGLLTAAYLAGRRRRYLRPLRVYLSATLLFFVLLALLDPVGRLEDSVFDEGGPDDSTAVVSAYLTDVEAKIAAEPERIARAERRADSLRVQLDSLTSTLAVDVPAGGADDVDSLRAQIAAAVPDSTYDDVFEGFLDGLEDAADDVADAAGRADDRAGRLKLEAGILRALPPDSTVRVGDVKAAVAQVYPENYSDIGLPDWAVRSESVRRLDRARTGRESAEAGMAFFREAIGKVPTVLFLVLPVFALLLKALYVRRGWYYSEHLVFGLHTHAFTFFVFVVLALLATAGGGTGFSSGSGWAGVLSAVLLCAVPVYFVVAQKRVYGQGWIKTILKSLVLGTVYSVVLFWGLVGALLLAAALG